ncbi:MAG: lysophospholipid acyltransferase family protein [Candidatus Taylorbacteria bacterium]|nr:lysophospholipid acyltransferase family protein [Candidatus Taylorbacteria bacterium]
MSLTAENITNSLELPATGRKVVTKERVVNEFARITQYVTWPFIYIIFNFFYCLKIQGRENFKNIQRPFVIIANHVDPYHSFVFRLVLGPATPHLPLRFMAVTKFEWKSLNFLASIGVIDFVYSLFGVFTIVPGLGIDKNLEKARDIIKAGGSIVIYPEGKINDKGGVAPFKKGAAVLIKETGVSTIPVSFRLGRRNFWWRELTVNVGKPILISKNNSVEKITDIFHKEVAELYENK